MCKGLRVRGKGFPDVPGPLNSHLGEARLLVPVEAAGNPGHGFKRP